MSPYKNQIPIHYTEGSGKCYIQSPYNLVKYMYLDLDIILLPGQGHGLQSSVCESSPTQSKSRAPLSQARDRTCAPPPQETEHSVQALQLNHLPAVTVNGNKH